MVEQAVLAQSSCLSLSILHLSQCSLLHLSRCTRQKSVLISLIQVSHQALHHTTPKRDLKSIYGHTSLHFLLLHFLLIEGLWHPLMEQVYPSQFSKGITHFMSLYHILSILKIFHTFSSLVYLLWWSINSDLCALQDWSLCFFQSCGSLTIKSCWPQDQIPWRFPVPLSDAQAGKPDVGFRTFTAGQELLWYYCSLACESHLASMEFDFVMIVPLLPFTRAFSLSLDVGYLFLVGSSILLSMVVQQLVAILVLSQEMNTHPSTLPSWTRSSPYTLDADSSILYVFYPIALSVCLGIYIHVWSVHIFFPLNHFRVSHSHQIYLLFHPIYYCVYFLQTRKPFTQSQ